MELKTKSAAFGRNDDMAYCWEFGGLTDSGAKCYAVARHGRCAAHPVERTIMRERTKDEILSLLDGTVTLREACQTHGDVEVGLIREWMRHDEEFKKAVFQATDHLHAHIADLAKENLRDKLLTGEASPTEVIHALRAHPDQPLAVNDVQEGGGNINILPAEVIEQRNRILSDPAVRRAIAAAAIAAGTKPAEQE